MKGRIYKTGLVLTAILTCLLMISTATAVPVANSEPVMDLVEEQEQLMELSTTIEDIINSDCSLVEKKESLLQLIIDEDITLEIFLLLCFYVLMIIFPIAGITLNVIIALYFASVDILEDTPYHRPPDTILEFITEFVTFFCINIVIGPFLAIYMLLFWIRHYLNNPP